MVGPSDAARALQLKQWKAHDAMYEALDAAYARTGYKDRELAHKDVQYLAAFEAYNKTVAELEALLGPTACCSKVDSDLWSLFSDCYKSDTGVRPRHLVTRLNVEAYLKKR
jgi:hypothetical protein